jgi:hypothetical protein
MQFRHTTVYKNISLLLKTAIVGLTLFYIYHKLLIKNDFEQLLALIKQCGFNGYIVATTVLMLFN